MINDIYIYIYIYIVCMRIYEYIEYIYILIHTNEMTYIFSYIRIKWRIYSHTYEWVMSHIYMRRVSRMDELCHACYLGWLWVMYSNKYEWVFWENIRLYSENIGLFMRTRMLPWVDYGLWWCKYSLTYECIMSHIWMRHVWHMNDSCPTYEYVVYHIWIWAVWR